jgi:type II secretory pathway component PulF
MSKETSIILPVLICLLEIYTQISKKHFNLKILMRRIIPFFIVLLLYMVRILRIVVPVFVSYYRTEVSLSVGFKHLLLYTSHAFNTHLEMFILSIFIPIAFLHVEDRKYALFSIRLLKNQVLRKIF